MDTRASLQSLGKKISTIRNRRKLSQSSLAEKIDMDLHLLEKLENGEINPDYLFLTKLTEALDISLEELCQLNQ